MDYGIMVHNLEYDRTKDAWIRSTEFSPKVHAISIPSAWDN